MNRKFLFSVFLIIAICYSAAAQYQWGTNIEFEGMLNSYVPSGYLIGEFSVGIDRQGVSLWSFEDPANPEPIVHLPLPGDNWIPLLNGNYLYIYSTFEGDDFIDVVDVSDPARAEFVNRIETPEGIGYYFFTHGDYVYVDVNEQLRRYSLEDPETPRLTDWEGESAGDYMTSSGDLYVFYLRDLEERSYTYTFAEMSEDGPDYVGSLEPEFPFHDIIIDNTLLLGVTYDDLFIFDFSDLDNIEEVSRTVLLPDEESRSFKYLKGGNGVAYLTGAWFLAIVDYGDPEAPELTDAVPTRHTDAPLYLKPLLLTGEYLYNIVNEGPTSPNHDSLWVRVYDLEDPLTLDLVNEIGFTMYAPGSSINYDDGLLYFNNSTQFLHTYIARDPLRMELQSIISVDWYEDGPGLYSRWIVPLFSNSIAYLGVGNGRRNQFSDFTIVNYENPAEPETLSIINALEVYPWNLQDSMLYCSNRDGLVILNVNDLNSPEVVRIIEDERFVGRIVVEDSLLYVRGGEQLNAFRLIDDEVEFVASREMLYTSYTLITRDTLIITTDSERGHFENWRLQVFQIDYENEEFELISEIASPFEWPPQYYTPGALREDGLIAIAGKDRILLFDIANLMYMHYVGDCIMPGWATSGITWIEDHLIVAEMHDLCILQPIFSEEGLTVVPDTLDFDRQEPFNETWLSFDLYNPADEGLAQVNDWGLVDDSGVFLIDPTTCWVGWVAAGMEIELEVGFLPQEEGEYFGELWYCSGEDTARVTLHGITAGWGVGDDADNLPHDFNLYTPYPNPFNSTTMITFSVSFASHVLLALYDLSGRRISTLVSDDLQPGIHTTTLNANDLPTGLYFVHLKVSGRVFTQKVILIR